MNAIEVAMPASPESRRLPAEARGVSSLCILCLVYLSVVSGAIAQECEWSVILTSGDTLAARDICQLTGSSLSVISDDASPREVPVDSLRMLIHHHQTQFQRGMLWGGLSGLVVGAVAGAAGFEEPQPRANGAWDFNLHIGPQDRFGAGLMGGLGGGLVGLLVGGVAGTIIGGNDTYDLESKSTAQRLKILRPLLRPCLP